MSIKCHLWGKCILKWALDVHRLNNVVFLMTVHICVKPQLFVRILKVIRIFQICQDWSKNNSTSTVNVKGLLMAQMRRTLQISRFFNVCSYPICKA